MRSIFVGDDEVITLKKIARLKRYGTATLLYLYFITILNHLIVVPFYNIGIIF